MIRLLIKYSDKFQQLIFTSRRICFTKLIQGTDHIHQQYKNQIIFTRVLNYEQFKHPQHICISSTELKTAIFSKTEKGSSQVLKKLTINICNSSFKSKIKHLCSEIPNLF